MLLIVEGDVQATFEVICANVPQQTEKKKKKKK